MIRAFHEFYDAPRPGEVYNLGGGRANSTSVLEAIDTAGRLVGKPMSYEHVDEARIGDHICYISDLRKLQDHYPNWGITKSLDDIWEDFARAGRER